MNENIKYRLLTLIRYLGDGLFYPFFALYLVSRNLTESKVGFLLALQPLFAIILNPLYTRLCSNIKKKKLILGIISTIEGIMIGIVSFSSNFYLITVLVFIIAIFGCCHYGLMDSLLAEYSDYSQTNYSTFRMFGSIAYIIATTLGGFITDKVNYQSCFVIAGAMFVLSSFLYYSLKEFSLVKKEELVEKPTKKDYLSIFKNSEFVIFMIFYGLTKGLIFTNNNYLSTYLSERGVTKSQYGIFYSCFVFIEIPTFLILSLSKKKFSNYILLIIEACSLIIRLFVCYIDAPIPVVIACTCLRGMGFAIVLHISFKYIIRVVGEKLSTVGIMLCEFFQAIMLFAFNNGNGKIIEAFGYTTFYLVQVIIAVITLILIFVMIILRKKHHPDFKLFQKNIE